jgi:ATP-dependent DNA helicase RecG
MDPTRFVDAAPRSRNEGLASHGRRAHICEERGSGWDKVGFQIELHQLPAPLVELPDDSTRVTLYAHTPLQEMDRGDRTRALYLHACLKYVSGEKVTNASVRQRFHIEDRNAAMASRFLNDAVSDGASCPTAVPPRED